MLMKDQIVDVFYVLAMKQWGRRGPRRCWGRWVRPHRRVWCRRRGGVRQLVRQGGGGGSVWGGICLRRRRHGGKGIFRRRGGAIRWVLLELALCCGVVRRGYELMIW